MDTLNTWGDQQHAYDPTNQCQLLVELARLPSSIPHAKHAAASTPRRPGAKLRFSTVELTVSGDMVTVDGRAEYKPCKASAHPVPPSKPLPQRILSLYAANNEGAYLMRLEERDDAQATMLVMPMSKRDGRVLEMLSESRRGSVGEVEKTKTAAVDDFTQRTDEASSNLYFYYYGMLQHQANMLQDHIRTGTYFAALTENAADFQGKAVMDVGCGSGILSFFAAQAGARVVYAVEASDFARHAAGWSRRIPRSERGSRSLRARSRRWNSPRRLTCWLASQWARCWSTSGCLRRISTLASITSSPAA